jgi:hypothetical protein
MEEILGGERSLEYWKVFEEILRDEQRKITRILKGTWKEILQNTDRHRRRSEERSEQEWRKSLELDRQMEAIIGG